MSHSGAIEKNYDVLLRCTTINHYVIDFLKAEAVIDMMQEAELRTQRNPLKQLILLFQWLKVVPSERYESFLQVMKDTEQEHVANLLRGRTEEGHLPLSELRYRRLDKIRPKIANVICIDIELIAELRSSKAISRTDTEDIRAEKVDYAKNSKLISAILRRTNECYTSFQEVLRKTKQTTAAQYLSEGEMPAVHVNNNLSYLDGALSSVFNNTLRNNSEGDVEIKELLTEMNGIGLNLVKAIPEQSIIIFVYCKTVQNATKFMQLFNSGRLRHMLERIFNRLLLTIESCNKEQLESRISLEDEEVNTLAEFTGIEGFLRESPTPKSGCIPSGKIYGCDANTQTDEESFMERITENIKIEDSGISVRDDLSKYEEFLNKRRILQEELEKHLVHCRNLEKRINLINSVLEIYRSSSFLPSPVLVGLIPDVRHQAVTGVTTLNREIFVTRDGSPDISVYEVNSNTFLRSLSLLNLLQSTVIPLPFDLAACHTTRSLYVADGSNNYIYCLELDGKLIHCRQVDNLRGLSVTKNGTVLVGSGRAIREYDTVGRLVRTLFTSSLLPSMKHPMHILEKDSGRIVVCAFGEERHSPHVVYYVDRRGGAVACCHGNRADSGDESLNEPCHMAIDVTGHVMVADRRNDRVKLLDADLTFVRDLIGAEQFFKRPQRLHYDPTRGFLYVGLVAGGTLVFKVTI